jgi:hypothetical protein
MNKVVEIVACFNISFLYFILRRYDKSLRWINKILNDAEADIRYDMLCLARIFNIIIHYELKNHELIENLEGSAYRYLQKKKLLYQAEKALLDFLKKNKNVLFEKKRIPEIFTRLKESVVNLSRDPYEQQLIEQFDMLAWIESKIQNKTFEEILKSKNRTSNFKTSKT